MKNITDKHPRQPLVEGRSTGIGFGFAKKLSDDEFELVMPISPCKDYLNEVVYAERVGQLLGKVYGFQYEKINNIFEENYCYLGIKVLPRKGGTVYTNFERDKANLANNYKNIEKLLRSLEDLVGFEGAKTQIHKCNDDIFIVYMPSFWTTKVYLTSLYTLLLRAGQFYDGVTPAKKWLDDKNFYNADVGLMMKAVPKFMKIVEGTAPKQPFSGFDLKDPYQLHNNGGIVNTNF